MTPSDSTSISNVGIIGGGAVGSFFAATLASSGIPVTMIVRGHDRRHKIDERGLLFAKGTRGKIDRVHVPTKSRIAPNDHFDLILVCVQRHQIESLVEDLSLNMSPRVMFVFNCASGAENWSDRIGPERQYWGLPAVVADIDKWGVLRYRLVPRFAARWTQITTIGSVENAADDLQKIRRLFQQSGIPTAVSPRIDSWLKSRGAFMAPMMGAAIKHPDYRRGRQFSARTARHISDAIHEGLTSVRASTPQGVTPRNLSALSYVPSPLLATAIAEVYRTPIAKRSLLHHASKTPFEVALMLEDLLGIANDSGVKSPALRQLHNDLTAYISDSR